MEIHHHQEHSHSVEGGEHHENKPVLKKVKEKVKKIKNTISKKRHGHGEDEHEHHEQDNDVSEEEEVYEEDEAEREVDPEVHGAPMYESAAARNLVGGRDENMGPGTVSLGEAMGMPVEDPTMAKKRDKSQLLYPYATDTTSGERRNLVRDRDENLDPQKVSLQSIAGSVEEDPAAPKSTTGAPAGATEQSHPSYSPIKGGDEVGVSPILSSFQALAGSDKPKGEQDVLDPPSTGTHDQFSPAEPQQDKPKEETEEQKSSSYNEKISSTAAAAKDAAVSAAIGSTEYGKKIASTVYEKVSGAGKAITGKEAATESQHDEAKPGQAGQPEKGVSDKGVSVKEFIVGKLRPGEEDRALSEVISDAVHSKKQEVVGTPEVKGLGEGSGGKGMVDKIKGAVRSWIGAGTVGGPQALAATNLDTEEKEPVTRPTETNIREGKMQ